MQFLKIISDDSSIEIIPLNKIFSIKVVMGKLYINGENKHLKVIKPEKFLDAYSSIVTQIPSERFVLGIRNEDGYAKTFVEEIKL